MRWPCQGAAEGGGADRRLVMGPCEATMGCRMRPQSTKSHVAPTEAAWVGSRVEH